MFGGKFNFFWGNFKHGPLLLKFLQKAEAEYFWAVLSWGLSIQGAGLRDRASEANEEGKPIQGSILKWNHYGSLNKANLFSPCKYHCLRTIQMIQLRHNPVPHIPPTSYLNKSQVKNNSDFLLEHQLKSC